MENIWIQVYRDTIEEHDKDWNITDILVTKDFTKKYFNDCVKGMGNYKNYEEFENEYTCDDTQDFYKYAMKFNAIIKMEHLE